MKIVVSHKIIIPQYHLNILHLHQAKNLTIIIIDISTATTATTATAATTATSATSTTTTTTTNNNKNDDNNIIPLLQHH